MLLLLAPFFLLRRFLRPLASTAAVEAVALMTEAVPTFLPAFGSHNGGSCVCGSSVLNLGCSGEFLQVSRPRPDAQSSSRPLPLFGQRPRRGPEGTLVLCNRGKCVCRMSARLHRAHRPSGVNQLRRFIVTSVTVLSWKVYRHLDDLCDRKIG